MDRSMPIQNGFNETLSAVLDDHRISQTQLAEATGLAKGYISRVVAGHHPVNPAITRYVYQRTKDQRIARMALGDGVLATAEPSLIDAPVERETLKLQTVCAMARVQQCMTSGNPADLRELPSLIDTAQRFLASSKLAAEHPIRFAPLLDKSA